MSCNSCICYQKSLCVWSPELVGIYICNDCLDTNSILEQQAHLRKNCFNNRYQTDKCEDCVQITKCRSENPGKPFRTTHEEERKNATYWADHAYVEVEYVGRPASLSDLSLVNIVIHLGQAKIKISNVECQIER